MLRSRSLLFALPSCWCSLGLDVRNHLPGSSILFLRRSIRQSAFPTRPAPYVKDPRNPRIKRPDRCSNPVTTASHENLVSARSFRGKMSVPTETGTMHGDIEFSWTRTSRCSDPFRSVHHGDLSHWSRCSLRVNTSTWTNLPLPLKERVWHAYSDPPSAFKAMAPRRRFRIPPE